MEIVYRPINTIKPLGNNPRKITQEQLVNLKQSIEDNKDYFECRPVILSDRTGELVAIDGNQRMRAAKELGWKEVPTILLSGLSEEREKEIIIRANVNNGEWDEDLLKGWDVSLLKDWGVNMSDLSGFEIVEEQQTLVAEEDDYEIEELPTKSKMGDIYALGEHRLICGDSTKEETLQRLMGDEVADLMVTDPPYNVAYKGGTKDALTIANDNMESAAFKEFLSRAFCNVSKFIKLGGVYYVWYASKEHINFESALKENKMPVRQVLIWNKSSFVLGRLDYHYKHEPCLYGWKEGACHYFTPCRSLSTVIELTPEDVNSMTKNELKKMLISIIGEDIPTDVIFEQKPNRNAEHPTMKPIRLIGKLIENSTKQGEIVIDIFGGSGSTLIACEQLNRKCRIVEYDPKYCDVIIDRWEKLTGKKAQLINS